ncbi:MAG: hypothetical protein ABI724_16440 [Betaproteobacteria bacterium]
MGKGRLEAFSDGVIAVMCGVAYFILSRILIGHGGSGWTLGAAVGKDFKGKISVVIYALAIPLSFANRWLAFGLYAFVAAMWFIPDRRIERAVDR